MKLVLKVVFVCIIIFLGFGVIGLFMQHKYTMVPIGPSALSKYEVNTLQKKGFITNFGDIVLFYSLKDIKESGCLLTNNRVISYDPGQDVSNCESAPYDSILEVKHNPSSSFANYGTINVVRIDSTKFTLVISPASNADEKFFNMLMKKWKQHRLIKDGNQ